MKSTTSKSHRGFTFMEILFAVMILGIGFIMVAAMFPAALRQTQANVEVTAFNTVVAKAEQDLQTAAYMYEPSGNYAFLQKTQTKAPARFLDLLTGWLANDTQTFPGEPYDYDPSNPYLYPAGPAVASPSVGRPYPFSFHDPRLTGSSRFNQQNPQGNFIMTAPSTGPIGSYSNLAIQSYLWDIVRGNLILQDKREFAYVPLWSRGILAPKATLGTTPGTPDASLNLFIFPVRSRAKGQYDSYPTDASGNANPGCDVAFNYANLDPQLIEIHFYPPPATNVNPAIPYGVLEIAALRQMVAATNQVPYGQTGTQQANPAAEGAYVVISDSEAKIAASANNIYPRALNGMIFKLGLEVADKNGTAGTSNGQYWAVAEIDNMPSEQPFNITRASQIGQNDFQAPNIFALVIGRQPDPGDAAQHSATTRNNSPYTFLNRTGPAQELGVIVTSVPLK